jgi:hypothetical protein
MKWLKTYKIFENYNRFGTKTLTEVEFDQIRKENCKNWTKVETELYRGMPDLGDYLYIDPLKGDFRSSIEDTNIHLDLLSNLPSWKDYPKYERCVIGGTRGSATGTYGESVYELIPFDDIKIVVCPKSTIWESLGNDDNEFGGDIYLVEWFLDSIGLDTSWEQIGGGTIETKLKSLGNSFYGSKISEMPNKDQEAVDNFLMRHAEFSWKRPNEITGEDCYNFINNSLFNPKSRGFQLLNYDQNFKTETGKQIWTEGPCLLIKSHLV